VGLGLEIEGSEGLLVLGEVLTEEVEEGFCLLGAEEDGLMVANGDFIRRFTGGKAEEELEVPHRDADLDRVGVGFAVIGGLGDGDFGLLWSAHGYRLTCPAILR